MTPQKMTALAKCFDASLTGNIKISPANYNAKDGTPAAKAASGEKGAHVAQAGFFNRAAPPSAWFNFCVEEVPQSGWGMVYQQEVIDGNVTQWVRTNVQCNPYAPSPNDPAAPY
jgi:hypothetical protein